MKRSGACTIALPIWHLDIPDFLEIQTEHGDMRNKAFDIFSQIILHDIYMEAVIKDKEWYLVDPYEVKKVLSIELPKLWGEEFNKAYSLVVKSIEENKLKLFKKVKAKDIFKSIMKAQISRGLPYLAFKDTINKYNPNNHDGYITSVNLCIESMGNVVPDKLSHICNLDSINLANVEEKEHEFICNIAVRILDNAIELTTPPIPEAKAHNERYRLIGVGMMGLADWMAKRELSYSASETSSAYPHKKVKELFEDLSYWCIKASANLASERGSYKAFEGSMWSKGELIGKPVDWFTQNANEPVRWKELSKQIISTGVRNGTILAIAPNTSSSLVQGCTASFLPTFSKFFTDKHSKGADPIIPPFIKESFWFYPEAKVVSPKRIVELVGDCIQPWIKIHSPLI